MIKGTYLTATEKSTILNDKDATAEQKQMATSGKVISDDAYAIVDLIGLLVDKIEQARGSFR